MSENVMKAPEGVTHWGAFMIYPDGKERLSFKEQVKTPRLTLWPLKELSEDTLRDRWGSGTYLLQWAKANEQGTLTNCGRSEAFVLDYPSHEEEEDEDENEEESENIEVLAEPPPAAVSAPTPEAPPPAPFYGGPVPAAPPPLPLPAQVPAVPPMMLPSVGAGDIINQSLALFHMHMQMASSARAEARAEQELMFKRYQVDQQSALERERMSHERQLENQRMYYKELTAAKGGPGGGLDPMALATVIEEKIGDAIDDIDERMNEKLLEVTKNLANGAATSQANQTAQTIGAIVDIAGRAMPMVQGMMNGGAAAKLPVPTGGEG